MKKLFQSNINALLRVRSYTTLGMTAGYKQVILNATNRDKTIQAVKKIDEAMKLLSEIQ